MLCNVIFTKTLFSSNVIIDAKLALRQKAEEISTTTSTTTATTSSTSNNKSPEVNKQEIKQESTHDTKDNAKEAETKPKKEETSSKEAIKPQDKSRPISSTPVPGTPWYV